MARDRRPTLSHYHATGRMTHAAQCRAVQHPPWLSGRRWPPCFDLAKAGTESFVCNLSCVCSWTFENYTGSMLCGGADMRPALRPAALFPGS